MFVWAQLDPNLVSIVGMLIAAIILRLGLSAARNPESKLHKVFTLVLAIIRYPLWIFTALVGGGLVLVGINIPGAGGILYLAWVVFNICRGNGPRSCLQVTQG